MAFETAEAAFNDAIDQFNEGERSPFIVLEIQRGEQVARVDMPIGPIRDAAEDENIKARLVASLTEHVNGNWPVE